MPCDDATNHLPYRQYEVNAYWCARGLRLFSAYGRNSPESESASIVCNFAVERPRMKACRPRSGDYIATKLSNTVRTGRHVYGINNESLRYALPVNRERSAFVLILCVLYIQTSATPVVIASHSNNTILIICTGVSGVSYRFDIRGRNISVLIQ